MPFLPYSSVMNFVTKRRYQIKSDGVIFGTGFQTESAVPQGSHCGPFLYLLFCNQISGCTLNTDTLSLLYADDTKFARTVNNSNDQKKLQDAIDNLYQWSLDNGLTINTSKTYHVSKPSRRQHYISQYYLGMNRITKNDTVVDLGITFDNTLSFVPRITSVASKLGRLYAMSYRFCNEVHHTETMIRIMKSYVLPIAEYASPIWDQDRKILNRTLERFLHMATRYVLHSPYRTDQLGYISFQSRMSMLHLNTFEERRIITAIIIHIKIYRGIIKSTVGELLRQSRYVPTHNTRNPNIFEINKRLVVPKSPTFIAMRHINTLKNIFNFETDSIDAIKTKLKQHFDNNRMSILQLQLLLIITNQYQYMLIKWLNQVHQLFASFNHRLW